MLFLISLIYCIDIELLTPQCKRSRSDEMIDFIISAQYAMTGIKPLRESIYKSVILYYIALHDNVCVGTVMMYSREYFNVKENAANLRKVTALEFYSGFVIEKMRRKGVLMEMVRRIIDQNRHKGYPLLLTLHIEINDNNTSFSELFNMYYNLGFTRGGFARELSREYTYMLDLIKALPDVKTTIDSIDSKTVIGNVFVMFMFFEEDSTFINKNPQDVRAYGKKLKEYLRKKIKNDAEMIGDSIFGEW